MGWVCVIVIKIYSGRTIQVHYFRQETISSLVKTAISFDRTLAQFIVAIEWHNKLHTGKVWKEAARHYIAYYPNASLEGLRKSALRPHIKVSRCASRDLNGAPPGHKFGYKFSVNAILTEC
jgi:hypothetical protein